MEMTLDVAALLDSEQIRPLKRVEYDRLVAEGFFANERVELLFGRVVEMSPIDQAHVESAWRIRTALERLLRNRAKVYEGAPFAATDDSEPEPDILVVPPGTNWKDHPKRAYLVVEVARSSLQRDREIKTVLYGISQVDEYWIVDHVNGHVEVFRDPRAGKWRTHTTRQRGETIALLKFPDVKIRVSSILPPLKTARKATRRRAPTPTRPDRVRSRRSRRG